MYVIMDGMDQAKTQLPHHRRVPKDLDKFELMQIHVAGIMAFGCLEPVQLWLSNDQFQSSGNMTVTVLHNALMRQAELLDAVSLEQSQLPLEQRRRWPPVLYIQADNSGKDNKNNIFFSYCAMLVKFGIFRKVKVNFGLVGHTHETIDQLFSRLST
jgi:hypothetical protein